MARAKATVQLELSPESPRVGGGELPVSWRLVQLEEATLLPRQMDPRTEPTRKFKYVDVSAVSNQSLEIQSSAEHLGSEAPTRARKLVRKGDVIFATVRPSLKRVAMVPADLDGELCSTAFCVIRADPAVADPEFLFFVLSNDEFVRRVAVHERGVSYPAVTDKVVLRERIALPSLPVQRAIARVLSTIRMAQKATREVIEAVRETKRSMMVALLRGREDGRQTEIGVIPEGWNVDKIGNLFNIQQGKALSPAARTGDSPKPFLRTANVMWGRIDLTAVDQMDFSDEEAEFYELQPGDLLICEGGDIGRTAIWNGELDHCHYQNHLHRLRPKKHKTVPAFYMYWMDAAFNLLGLYGGLGNRTTIPNLSKGRLSGFPVPVPPAKDQQRISRRLQVLDAKIRTEEVLLGRLDSIYQTLLHELLSGNIRLALEEVEAHA